MITIENIRARRYGPFIAGSLALAELLVHPAPVYAATEGLRSELPTTAWYGEMWSLAIYAIREFSGHSNEFVPTLIGAIILAILCWLAATGYSRLWNLHFRITLKHHIFCLLAALLTLVFVVLFASLQYARVAAETSIDRWREGLLSDTQWANQIFIEAYKAVKALGIEDFSHHPLPEDGGSTIPQTKPESIAVAASIYANSAVADFRYRRPFLSNVLSVRPEIPQATINNAVTDFFAKGGETYDLKDAVDIATGEIKKSLQPQTGRVVVLARGIFVGLFLLVQLIPFSLISFAAYNDVKVTT